MTERAMSKLDRWATRVIVFCALGTCVCFVGLGYLQIQLRTEAERGGDARTRQQQVFPVSVKAYSWIESQGGISMSDLECIKTGRLCPPRKTTP